MCAPADVASLIPEDIDAYIADVDAMMFHAGEVLELSEKDSIDLEAMIFDADYQKVELRLSVEEDVRRMLERNDDWHDFVVERPAWSFRCSFPTRNERVLVEWFDTQTSKWLPKEFDANAWTEGTVFRLELSRPGIIVSVQASSRDCIDAKVRIRDDVYDFVDDCVIKVVPDNQGILVKLGYLEVSYDDTMSRSYECFKNVLS